MRIRLRNLRRLIKEELNTASWSSSGANDYTVDEIIDDEGNARLKGGVSFMTLDAFFDLLGTSEEQRSAILADLYEKDEQASDFDEYSDTKYVSVQIGSNDWSTDVTIE